MAFHSLGRFLYEDQLCTGKEIRKRYVKKTFAYFLLIFVLCIFHIELGNEIRKYTKLGTNGGLTQISKSESSMVLVVAEDLWH